MVKKILKKSDSYLTVLIVIGLLIVVNFFSYQIFGRWDLTENNDYSISQVSKQSVGKLDDVVKIKVYFSKDLPSQFVTLRQEVGDILDEYRNYSNGKIRVEFLDPAEMEERDLFILGIPPLQFNVMEKDKYQVVKGYLGMVVQYGDKKEVIPVVENTINFEYQVTLAIKKVTSDEMATIGIVGESAGIQNAYKKLEELYIVREVDLTSGVITSDINTLVIIGLKEDLSEEALQAIDAFLIKGGSILVLMDGVNVEEGLLANTNTNNLVGLLENYGIKLNNDLVLDVSSGMASFSSGFITFSTNYPYWPKVVKAGFDSENVAVAKLETLLLPWASSLDYIGVEENNVSYLAQTTDRAWAVSENFDLNPQQQFFPSGNVGQKILALSVFGSFTSAYGAGSTDVGRLIVVGDSEFIGDNFLQQSPDNLVFFQNLVDSLSLDEDLINIRSKGVTERPIKELSEGQKAITRYLNVFGLTLVIIAFGLIRYFIRRRSRFVDSL